MFRISVVAEMWLFYLLVLATLLESAHSSPIKNAIPNKNCGQSKPNEKTLSPEEPTNWKFNVSVITWNLAEKELQASGCEFLRDFRNSDFIVIGVQECEDIKPRRHEGRRSRAWKKIQETTFGRSFECLAQHKIGGIQLAVYCKRKLAKRVQGVQVMDVACGIGNVLSNKGAICVLLRMKGKTLALINAHLAAHQGKVKERNADYHRIMSTIKSKAPKRWLHKSSKLKSTSVDMHETSSTRRSPLKSSQATTIQKEQPSKSSSLVDRKNRLQKQKMSSTSRKSVSIGSPARTSQPHSAESATLEELIKPHRSIPGPIPKIIADEVESLICPSMILDDSTGLQSPSAPPSRSATSPPLRSASTAVPTDVAPKFDPFFEISWQDSDSPFDAVIFLGDLNYRVELPRLEVELSLLRAGLLSAKRTPNTDTRSLPSHPQLQALLSYDQLTRERYLGRVFRGFQEKYISFPPTFKYDRGSDNFDSSSKRRCPAWTDRILYSNRRWLQDGHSAHTRTHSHSHIPCPATSSHNGSSAVSTGSHNLSISSDGSTRQQPLVNSEGAVAGLGAADIVAPRDVDAIAMPSQMLTVDSYRSIPCRHSDHRPVCATFTLTLQ